MLMKIIRYNMIFLKNLFMLKEKVNVSVTCEKPQVMSISLLLISMSVRFDIPKIS